MVFLYKDIMIELDQISQTDLCMLSFKSYLQETKSKVSLGGMSRGSGKSKFETYEVDDWERMKSYDFSLIKFEIFFAT